MEPGRRKREYKSDAEGKSVKEHPEEKATGIRRAYVSPGTQGTPPLPSTLPATQSDSASRSTMQTRITYTPGKECYWEKKRKIDIEERGEVHLKANDSPKLKVPKRSANGNATLEERFRKSELPLKLPFA